MFIARYWSRWRPRPSDHANLRWAATSLALLPDAGGTRSWAGAVHPLQWPEVFIPQLRAMLRANVGLNDRGSCFP